jgi:SAM-dependent methyltransferase
MTRMSYLLDNLAPQAGGRFAGLEACFDETTFRHLTAVGIGPAWRCWEIGAGSGSVAGWMAERVGKDGAVLATDLNVDWIRTNISPRVEIRLHDLTSDEIPRSAYDLIHARLVLVHLPQRDAIISRLVSALAPSGWLVLEEFFDGFPSCPEPETEQERTFERVLDAFRQLLRRRGADTTSYTSTLPWRLKRTGLVGVGGEGKLLFAHGSTPGAGVLEANLRQTGDLAVEAGLIAAGDLTTFLRLVKDPQFTFALPLLVSAWGQRRASA